MNKKLNTRIFITLGLVVLLIGAMVVAGCTDNIKKTGEVPPPLQKQSIKVSGSTTVLPIAQKAAEAYMATHQNADIQISGGGSGVGLQQIGEKTVDIGMSSRDLKATESTKYPDLVKHIVAKDGIALVVNPKNEIRGIQAATVADIYTGKITLWTQIPGAHLPGTNTQIVVIGRDSASGTREFFDTHANGILKGTPPTKSMLEKNSNGAVAQTITQTPGAIGYVSIGFVTGDVKAVPVWYNDSSAAVAPTRENVLSGAYPINRDLFMFTNGQPSGLAADFIGFIRSPDGQKIVEEEGYVRIG
jgi:phosphate transport system substrate-binding protein